MEGSKATGSPCVPNISSFSSTIFFTHTHTHTHTHVMKDGNTIDLSIIFSRSFSANVHEVLQSKYIFLNVPSFQRQERNVVILSRGLMFD
jgi:hypothetical protein